LARYTDSTPEFGTVLETDTAMDNPVTTVPIENSKLYPDVTNVPDELKPGAITVVTLAPDAVRFCGLVQAVPVPASFAAVVGITVLWNAPRITEA
jgi:hypothetical protein